MSDFIEEINQDEIIAELKRANIRILRKYDTLKRNREDYVEALYGAARDAFLNIHVSPVKPPAKDKRRKDTEVAAVVLSDWQLGKVTPDYNSEVCEQRVKLMAEKVIELTKIQQADHPVKELRVWLVGDIVEGEDIFPGQFELIDSPLYRQLVQATEMIADFIRTALTHFETVHVVGVIGNHGRVGRKGQFSVETNADRWAYTYAKMLLKGEDRVTWEIPEGNLDHWYAVDTVGEKSFFLWHGYNIRGQSGMPWYGFNKKVAGWANDGIPQKFDYAVCGHWHQAASFPINKKIVYVNGSTESSNSFAAEQLAAASDPSQWLFFVHPKRGITAEYRCWLDKE